MNNEEHIILSAASASENFAALLSNIQRTHDLLKEHAIRVVNISSTVRNWLIGFYITEYEQNGKDRADYGGKLLQHLSDELTRQKLPNVSVGELSRFRQFYATYPQFLGTLSQKSNTLPNAILGTLSQNFHKPAYASLNPEKLLANLSFSHFVELIKIDDPIKRLFYEVETIKGMWSIRELRRQINTLFYERTGLSQKPEKLIALTQEQAISISPDEIIKSPFTFEFLGLRSKDVVRESDMEDAIIDNLQNFLLEFGTGFCFEARQKRILIECDSFFIDLVFYHRILHCHVLVEIKVDEFNHEHIGQLNAYVEHYKRNVMSPGDNPPIGILLVTNKNNTLVEYAKGSMDNNLFVSKYLLALPDKSALIKIIKSEATNV